MDSIARVIRKRNAKGMDRVCLTYGVNEYTYKDLFSYVDKIKAFLDENAERGDRIGLFCENGIEFVSVYLACLDSGVVVVPVNTNFSKEEMDYVVKNCEIRLFMCSERMKGKLDIQVPVFLISDILEETEKGKKESYEARENELAALMHTSGSTGKPNAVMVTHGNIIANTKSILDYLDNRPDDRVMVVLPFFYCYGASLLHMTLWSGGRVVINNKFMFPQKVVDEICEKKCTVFAGVPSTYQIMLKYTRMKEMDMSCLRYVLQAGGKLSNEYLLKLKNTLPETKIIVMYGQTEATARLSYLPPELFDSKLGSIGKGIPGVKLRVVNEKGKDVKPGEVGEIIARGKNICSGYLNNEEETENTFRNGWLYTGDLATVDEEGFIFIVDRKRDFVKVGGNRVSLSEIENAAEFFDGVKEAVAVGFPDEILGEAIALFVVPENDSLKPEDIMKMCRKKLSAYKIPKKINLIDKIPRNAYGKVQRFKLIKEIDIHG